MRASPEKGLWATNIKRSFLWRPEEKRDGAEALEYHHHLDAVRQSKGEKADTPVTFPIISVPEPDVIKVKEHLI